jgi:hypothetical protein
VADAVGAAALAAPLLVRPGVLAAVLLVRPDPVGVE